MFIFEIISDYMTAIYSFKEFSASRFLFAVATVIKYLCELVFKVIFLNKVQFLFTKYLSYFL